MIYSNFQDIPDALLQLSKRPDSFAQVKIIKAYFYRIQLYTFITI